MSNLEKYIAVFTGTLLVEESALANLKYQDIPAWDSVGHMSLMSAIEESFEIEIDIDDIIEFSSFKVGYTILAKYNINLE
jgi:acyl carrier protein